MNARAFLSSLYVFFLSLLSKGATEKVEELGEKFDKLADELDTQAERLDQSVDAKLKLVQVIAAKASDDYKAAEKARDLAQRARLVR